MPRLKTQFTTDLRDGPNPDLARNGSSHPLFKFSWLAKPLEIHQVPTGHYNSTDLYMFVYSLTHQINNSSHIVPTDLSNLCFPVSACYPFRTPFFSVSTFPTHQLRQVPRNGRYQTEISPHSTWSTRRQDQCFPPLSDKNRSYLGILIWP